MDSVSGYAGEPRSGGKILRPRRRAVVRKPYDRPPPPPRSQDPPSEQNPSWISKFVYKPATVIASGAGKFISSVVFSESSSSSEEDDEDFASDEDEDAEKNITDFTEDETTDLVDAGGSTFQRLGSKRAIEQLLMQETFAREEGDRLIDIIKARIVDNPSDPTANGGRHGLTNDVYVDEMSRKAVMEAIKWSEEKKAGSSSKCKGIEDGPGSPVFVAKSYMQARPRWGSPAVNNLEFQSPSSAGMQLFNEGTPFPYSAGSFSSSKLKRKSRSIQSWNIQDEIRKVRVKATEEMLKGVSPSTVALLEPKHSPYVLDASLNADKGVQAVRNEGSRVPPKSTIPTTEKDQTMEANQAVEEEAVALHTRSHGVVLDETFISTQGVKPSEDTNTPQRNNVVNDSGDQDEVTTNAVLALGATLDPTGNFCVPKDVFETSKEADETGAGRHTSNGFPSSTPSLPVAMEGQPKSKPPDDETEASQRVAETPGDDITVENGSDGAIDNENNNSDSSASHNSSSTREEEWLPGDQSLPNSNSASSSPGNTKVLANAKRGGRGRGRGRGGRGGRGKGRAK